MIDEARRGAHSTTYYTLLLAFAEVELTNSDAGKAKIAQKKRDADFIHAPSGAIGGLFYTG